jgi:hypothetical protein
MSNPDDAEPELKSEWLEHMYTKMLQRQGQEARGEAILALEKACMDTTDPAVARAHGIGMSKTSSIDAAESAVQWEQKVKDLNKAVKKTLKPKGFFKHLSPLLDQRRLAANIPNGFFKQSMVFDRILIFQLPGDDGETFGDTMIIRPEASAVAEKSGNPKGVLVSAGLNALDTLRANGIELGHVVTTIRNAPWHMKMDTVNGHDMFGLVMRAGDITASEDLSDALADGSARVEIKEVKHEDGVITRENHYVDPQGRTWNPELPFIGDDT